MKEILKLSRKKKQKTLPINKKNNTLEKKRSWGGECRDQNRQGSFCLFLKQKIFKKQTNQKQIRKRKSAEQERGEKLE